MQRQQGQVDILFQDLRTDQINQYSIELFVTQFDHLADKCCEQIEDQLRQSVESMASYMARLIDQWKINECDRWKQSNDLQIKMRKKKTNNIKEKYDQIINQSEQIINQQRNRYDQMIMKYDGRLEQIKQLKECKNEVIISNYNNLDDSKRQIEEYQQDNKQYQIHVDFYTYSSMWSIDSKIDVIEMINTLNANRNVGRINITFNVSNKWNSEILILIANRYTNVYSIGISDSNKQVDHQMHDLIKQYVQQQPIMLFMLYFWRSMYNNNAAYELIKQYNQLIKQKQYLEELWYYHGKIGGTKNADTKEEIEELIDEISK